MRKSASGRCNDGPKRGGKTVSPFRGSAPDSLTIPLLAKDIAYEYSHDPYGSRWARIAMLWLDEGELSDADTGHPRELACLAVKRWVERQVEGMRLLAHFDIVVGAIPDRFEHYRPGVRGTSDSESWLFCVSGGNELPFFVMEPRISKLEETHPGLGQTAFKAFRSATYRLLPIFDPEMARMSAMSMHWFGMETQEDFEEEAAEAYGAESASEVDGPDAFDEKFPTWMFGQGTTLDREALQNIAARGKTTNARAVANSLLALPDKQDDSYRLPWLRGDSPCDEDAAYHLAYLRWNEDDPVLQMVDDHMNYANQCGDCYTDLLGADAVPLNPKAFKKWKKEIEAGFAVLKQLDALLPLIADPA